MALIFGTDHRRQILKFRNLLKINKTIRKAAFEMKKVY